MNRRKTTSVYEYCEQIFTGITEVNEKTITRRRLLRIEVTNLHH